MGLEKIFKAMQKIFEYLADPFAHGKFMLRLAGKEISLAARFNIMWSGLPFPIAFAFVVGAMLSGRVDYAFQGLVLYEVNLVLCLVFVSIDHFRGSS